MSQRKAAQASFLDFHAKLKSWEKHEYLFKFMSICSCPLPCNVAYHGTPNEVLAPVQVDNAGCLLGGNYKAPMVIIPKNKSGLVFNIYWN